MYPLVYSCMGRVVLETQNVSIATRLRSEDIPSYSTTLGTSTTVFASEISDRYLKNQSGGASFEDLIFTCPDRSSLLALNPDTQLLPVGYVT